MNRIIQRDMHPYTLWETQGPHNNKIHWSMQELKDLELERNIYFNMLEDDILAAFEAFDRKMCLDRGVVYDIESPEEDGFRRDGRQIILPDAALAASNITPASTRDRLNFLFGVCSTIDLQSTFVQRVCAYLQAKIKEVEHAIESNFKARYALTKHPDSPTEHMYDTDARYAFSIDSTLLDKIKFVYDERFQKYTACHNYNMRHAYYKKRKTPYPWEDDKGKGENFLTSRPR